MNTKGQSGYDLVIFIVVIFFIAMLGLIFVKMYGGINTGMQSQAAVIGSTAATASDDANTGLTNGFDTALILAIGLMYIGLFISSRYIGTHPMWLFINVFFLVIALGLAAVLGNAYDLGSNNPQFVTERAAMPGATFIADNLLLFGIGALAMICIGLFAKPGGGEQQE